LLVASFLVDRLDIQEFFVAVRTQEQRRVAKAVVKPTIGGGRSGSGSGSGSGRDTSGSLLGATSTSTSTGVPMRLTDDEIIALFRAVDVDGIGFVSADGVKDFLAGGGGGAARGGGSTYQPTAAATAADAVAPAHAPQGGRRGVGLASGDGLERLANALRVAAYRFDWDELFDKLDCNGDGSLNLEEFQQALRMQLHILQADISDAAIEAMFLQIDEDGDGGISASEFREFLWLDDLKRHLLHAAETHPWAAVFAAFDTAAAREQEREQQEQQEEQEEQEEQEAAAGTGGGSAGGGGGGGGGGSGELGFESFCMAVRHMEGSTAAQITDDDLAEIFHRIDINQSGSVSAEELMEFIQPGRRPPSPSPSPSPLLEPDPETEVPQPSGLQAAAQAARDTHAHGRAPPPQPPQPRLTLKERQTQQYVADKAFVNTRGGIESQLERIRAAKQNVMAINGTRALRSGGPTAAAAAAAASTRARASSSRASTTLTWRKIR
jgi:Ca2+-binding EF-hand superfamily protein